MKKGDLIWGVIFVGVLSLFIIPITQNLILDLSDNHPYISGFLKFALLATLGDLLGSRIATGDYIFASLFYMRVLVWGVIGLMVTLVFPTYMGGAAFSQEIGVLPFQGVNYAQAFFGSAIMNLTFAPVMNTFHRLCDLYLNKKGANKKTSLKALIDEIDWPQFIIFNWIKVGILFWIPVHTVIFLLPENVQVSVAAFTSIFLGVILSFAAKKENKKFVEEDIYS